MKRRVENYEHCEYNTVNLGDQRQVPQELFGFRTPMAIQLLDMLLESVCCIVERGGGGGPRVRDPPHVRDVRDYVFPG